MENETGGQREIDALHEIMQTSVNDEGTIQVPLDFVFNGTVNTSATSVAESLMALDKSVYNAAYLLAKTTGAKIPRKASARLSVVSIKKDSLAETFIVDIGLGGKDNARALLMKLIDQIGFSATPEATALIMTAVTTSLVTLGAVYAIRRFRKKEPTAMINAHNSIVVYAAKSLNISPTVFQRILDALPGKRRLAENVAKAMLPGRENNVESIRIGDKDAGVVITREQIEELPSRAELDVLDTSRELSLDHVRISVVAGDAEKGTSGWAAYLPDDHPFGGVRIRVVLADTINPESVMYKKTLCCSGKLTTVVRNGSDAFRPTVIAISVVHPD